MRSRQTSGSPSRPNRLALSFFFQIAQMLPPVSRLSLCLSASSVRRVCQLLEWSGIVRMPVPPQ